MASLMSGPRGDRRSRPACLPPVPAVSGLAVLLGKLREGRRELDEEIGLVLVLVLEWRRSLVPCFQPATCASGARL